MNNHAEENSNNETESYGVCQIPMYSDRDTIVYTHPSDPTSLK